MNTPTDRWTLSGTPEALRLQPEKTRSLNSRAFTWAHFLYGELLEIDVYTLYFPSRFELPVDEKCKKLLRDFGANTSKKTSVNFWDPRDENFERALKFFDLEKPPAIVLVSGLGLESMDPVGPEETDLFSISFADADLLENEGELANALNRAHTVFAQGNPKEISAFLRSQKRDGILSWIGKLLGKARDELLRWKPKIGLPDGTSIELG
ncbi:MAG: hypothetical protein QNJ87_07755 [Gammaproteobacteria bacterium]|nr:hypothetical protein [Gammaproteobacteria bacterium]MDJ0871648.1 hypothetical protein [Gammaproteobacteria bacterium]MDJ0890896.1 hypothetical protein [Gammaproteobacteria bacterium]